MNFRTDYEDIEKKLAKKAAKIANKSNPKENKVVTTGKISVAKKRVVITGSIPGMTRSQAAKLLNVLGTSVYPTVTIGIDYLIIGNTKGVNTSKMQIASYLKVPTVNYTNVKELN
jgi:NAD-dependent DNA ligase